MPSVKKVKEAVVNAVSPKKKDKSDKKERVAKIKPVEGDAAFPSKGEKIDEKAFEEAAKASSSSGYDPVMLADVLLKFGKILTGMPLYHYQEAIAWRIFLAVLRFEGSVLTVLLSRQSGKSETMAVVIDTLTVLMPTLAKVFAELEQYKDGFRIGLFAPQSDQVWTTYNRAMMRLGTENALEVLSDPDINVELESEVRLALSNGSFLTGQIASKQSKIESKTYDLVIAEESQDIEDFIIDKSIEPMVAATGGTIVKVGTTGTVKNHFWKEIQRNRNLDRKITDERMRNHFEFDYKKIIKYRREQFDVDGKTYHLHYENTIRRTIERKGEDAEDFKLSYALIWSLETGMLITDQDWERINNKKKGLDGYDDDDDLVAGYDIGKTINSSVITIGKIIPNEDDEFAPVKKQVVAWIELVGIDYEAQHHILLDILVRYGIKKLALDYTGVGKAVGDRLMHACGDYVHIIPFTFGSQTKSELGYAFLSDISARRLIVPANKQTRATREYQRFEEQMKNCQKYYNGPYLVYEKSEGYMDDYVDSCALMCHAADDNTEGAHEVEEEPFNPFYSHMDEVRRASNSAY